MRPHLGFANEQRYAKLSDQQQRILRTAAARAAQRAAGVMLADRFVWSSAPWTRVGPPVRKVP